MTRVRSGLVLIGVGVVLNLLGRLVTRMAGEHQGVGMAGALLVIAAGSVVICLFGIIRLVHGLVTRS